MTEYKKIITNKGLELITSSSLNGEELVIKSIVIGDANGENYEPTAAQTSLVHQKNELQISEMIVNSETSYTFLAQIPNDIDYYVIREIGLLDENDNLLEIAQMEQETYIQSDNLIQQLTVGIRFDVGQSSTVVVLADTNIETASKDFVNDNFQNLNEKNQANGYAGLDANAKLPLTNVPIGVELTTNKDVENGYCGLDNNALIPLPRINIASILEAIYPVGSVYLSTSSTCPLSSIFGTWTKKATSIITSVNSTGSVVGNGKSLGFTDGSQNFGITFTTAFANAMTASAYNKDVGTSSSYTALTNTAKAIGVVTSANKSGLVANITSTNMTVNIFERTA